MRKNDTANNLWGVLLAFIVGVGVFGNVTEAQTKRPKKKPTAQKLNQANDKIEYAPDADLLKKRIALIKRWEFGHTMGIVTALVALLEIPFGTIFGIYAIRRLKSLQ